MSLYRKLFATLAAATMVAMATVPGIAAPTGAAVFPAAEGALPGACVALPATPGDTVPTEPDTSESAPARPHPVKADPLTDPTVADFNVAIDDLKPRVLTQEDKLLVTATVTSRTRTLGPIRLDVFMQSRSEVTMEALRSYLAGNMAAGRWVGQYNISKLEAGQSQSFTIEIDRAQLPLYSEWEWGPRGISVQASSAELEAIDRSVLVWDSGYPVEPTKAGAIAPISEDVAVRGKDITLAAPADSKLETHLQLARIRGVIAAAPPTLLDGDRPLGAAATQLPSQVVLLPVADADIAAIAHLPNSDNVATLVRESKTASSVQTVEAGKLVDNWVLPQLPRLDLTTLSAWPDQTVVAPTDINPVEPLTYRPSVWSRYNAHTGEATGYDDPDGVNVLVPDDEISQLLDAPSPSAGAELDTQQLLIASTAIITRQLPNMGRTVLAVSKHREGDYPAHTVARFQALLQQRWVEPLTAQDLSFDQQPDLVVRQPIGPSAPATSGVTAAELERLHRAVESTAAMSSAVQDSSTLAENLRERVLLVTAYQLRLQPAVRRTLIDGVVEETRHFSQAVKVAQSAPINLLDSKANLPVRVSNDLEEDVSVLVELKPSDPRLQIVEDVAVDVPAKGGVLAEIPVKAVASGNVTIQVIVKGPNGLVIDDNTTLTVRVRAEWETIGVAILGVGLVLLVLVGIIRTVRKGRKMERANEDDDFRSV